MADIVRYYLPSSGAAAHTPDWDASFASYYNNAYKYAAVTTKIVSTQTEKEGAILQIGTETVAGVMWVSPAQSAHEWTTNDAIEAQLYGRYNANVTSASLYAVFRVMNADCSSNRGILWEGTLPTPLTGNWRGNSRALTAGGGHVHVQNAVSMQGGDHIVIEVGFTITGTAQYAGCIILTGDDQDSDFPVNETTTTYTDDVWVEFTMEAASGVDVTPTPTEITGTFSQPAPIVAIVGPAVGAYVSPTIIMGW